MLVTGASGFVGGALVRGLHARGVQVVASVRHEVALPEGVRVVRVGDLGPSTDWQEALAGCDVVVHCAARVHVMAETAAHPLAAFRAVNVEGAVSLARQAAEAGVKRFVFVSSVKVNGEQTAPGRPFTAHTPPAPVDAYGVSKAEAEQALRSLAGDVGIELVIVRPPLVYGPGVKANFASMVHWLRRGVPLPFGRLTSNRRTLVGIDNLVDLLITCAVHPDAAGETFYAGDGEDLSTADLLRRTARALGVRARLLPVPASVLRVGSQVAGLGHLWQRLGGDLQVDIAHTTDVLGWRPPVSVDEGLRRAVGTHASTPTA